MAVTVVSNRRADGSVIAGYPNTATVRMEDSSGPMLAATTAPSRSSATWLTIIPSIKWRVRCPDSSDQTDRPQYRPPTRRDVPSGVKAQVRARFPGRRTARSAPATGENSQSAPSMPTLARTLAWGMNRTALTCPSWS